MRKMRDSFHLLVVYFFLQQDFDKDFNNTDHFTAFFQLGLQSLSNNGKVIRLEKWNKDIAYSDKVDVTSYISR